MSEQQDDLSLFMICDKVNTLAYSELPDGYKTRFCKPEELDIWKTIHFDDEKTAIEYRSYMDDYYDNVYAPKGNLFFESCLFVVDTNDKPIATCFIWKSYDKITTLHWYKVVKEYEGMGIGRALLTIIMKSVPLQDYPILLHTQPDSDRAIKLYSDFGFKLIIDKKVGNSDNHFEEGLSILKTTMPKHFFDKLQFTTIPIDMHEFLSTQLAVEY